MYLRALPIFLTLTTSAFANPVPDVRIEGEIAERAAAVTCTTGAVVFGVRGSSNNPTTTSDPAIYSALPAQFTQIANAAFSKAGGGYLQAIAYPASDPQTNNGANYGPSVSAGIASLQDTIYNYVNSCTTGKIVVLGYSQGAQVASGALGGSTTRGPLKAHGRVTAAAIFADPTFRDGFEPIDQGSGANNGKNGTVPGDGSKYAYLDSNFASRLRSYCQAGDEFCDSGTGSDAGTIHQNSPAYFESAAQAFVTSLL